MPAAFGGPATSLVRIVLEPSGGSTVFRLTDSELRRVTDKTRSTLEEGWRLLFEQAFKVYVETGELA